MSGQAQAREAALEAAIREALADGVTYEDDLVRRVRPQVAPIDEVLDNFLGEHHLPDDQAAERALLADLGARVAAGPRGTWAITARHRADLGQTWYRALISDGSGKLAVGGSSDAHTTPPSFEQVYSRMFGYEVFLARRVVTARRERDADLRAVADCGITVGNEHRGAFAIDGHTFSRIVVTAVDPDTGKVGVQLVKRGSRRDYTATLGADTLARLADLPRTPTLTLADLPPELLEHGAKPGGARH